MRSSCAHVDSVDDGVMVLSLYSIVCLVFWFALLGSFRRPWLYCVVFIQRSMSILWGHFNKTPGAYTWAHKNISP